MSDRSRIYYNTFDDRVVFAQPDLVERLRGIDQAKTWGELREVIGKREYESILTHIMELDFDRPASNDTFSIEMVPGVEEGDWPEWPAQVMAGWFPTDLAERFGESQSSVHNGPYLHLPLTCMSELLTALHEQGYECIETDQFLT